jgi:eukaryotic-like serine/threonine-protein kinase
MDGFNSADAVLRQLNRILGSATFQGAARSQALLRFLVTETVEGRSERLKEYTLGAEGLGKGDSFDPRIDPVVRAEASRLRSRLERYYTGEGTADEIVIQLPKGTYVPQFRTRSDGNENDTTARAATRPSTVPLVWFAVAAITLAAVTTALWARPRASVPPFHEPAVMRFDVDLDSQGTLSSDVGTDVMLSPDGTRVVFVIQGADGESRLNTRRLDQSAAVDMIGTEGARGPFFSPEGQWVAFWAGAKLKKSAVAGGPPQIICDAPDLLGGSWGDDGNIVAAFTRTQLSRVPSFGGSPEVIADFAAESLTPRWPQVLPGSRLVLFTAVGATGPNTATVNLLSLADGATRVLVRNGTFGRYLEGGYLTYVNQGTLFAVQLSPDRMAVHGTSTPILDDVAYSPVFGFAEMDASRTGTLVYRRSAGGGQFVLKWLDETGLTTALLATPGQYGWPRLSPDGQRVALAATESGSDVVLVRDVRDNQTTRIAMLAGKYGFPLWTRDGQLLVVGGAKGLAVVEPTGTGKPQPLLQSDAIQIPWSFSPDGRHLAYYQMSSSNGFDLWTVPVQKSGPTLSAGQPQPFLQSPNFEVYPSFSPDGRWLAYSSNETGTWEVYVRAFPDNGTKVRVSTAGGRVPLWVTNRTALVYETDQQTLMELTYTVRSGSFVAGKPRPWGRTELGNTGVLANFDVAPDGRVVALMPAAKSENDAIRNHATFILNFADLVRRRLEPAAQ